PAQTQFITGGVTPYNSFTVTLFNAGGTGLTTQNLPISAAAGTVSVSGTGAVPAPTAAGTVTFNTTVTDANNSTFVIANTVTVNPPLSVDKNTLNSATKNILTNQVITVNGGTSPAITINNFNAGTSGLTSANVTIVG